MLLFTEKKTFVIQSCMLEMLRCLFQISDFVYPGSIMEALVTLKST